MAYSAQDFRTNPDAPVGAWVCTRTSPRGPFTSLPPEPYWHGPDFCGQCVSFVTRVCPDLPVSTSQWRKGRPVKGDTTIKEGTVIATFNGHDKDQGHAAIYVSQDNAGINVFDQWVFGAGPQPIHPRHIKWQGNGVPNTGDDFFVVEG